MVYNYELEDQNAPSVVRVVAYGKLELSLHLGWSALKTKRPLFDILVINLYY